MKIFPFICKRTHLSINDSTSAKEEFIFDDSIFRCFFDFFYSFLCFFSFRFFLLLKKKKCCMIAIYGPLLFCRYHQIIIYLWRSLHIVSMPLTHTRHYIYMVLRRYDNFVFNSCCRAQLIGRMVLPIYIAHTAYNKEIARAQLFYHCWSILCARAIKFYRGNFQSGFMLNNRDVDNYVAQFKRNVLWNVIFFLMEKCMALCCCQKKSIIKNMWEEKKNANDSDSRVDRHNLSARYLLTE